jgi:hypothetical protein
MITVRSFEQLRTVGNPEIRAESNCRSGSHGIPGDALAICGRPTAPATAIVASVVVQDRLPACPLEPYGMMILIGVLFIPPMIGAQLGLDFNVVSQSIATVTDAVISVILRITGHS